MNDVLGLVNIGWGREGANEKVGLYSIWLGFVDRVEDGGGLGISGEGYFVMAAGSSYVGTAVIRSILLRVHVRLNRGGAVGWS